MEDEHTLERRKKMILRKGVIIDIVVDQEQDNAKLIIRDSDTEKIQKINVERERLIRLLYKTFGSLDDAIGSEIMWWKGKRSDLGGIIPVTHFDILL